MGQVGAAGACCRGNRPVGPTEQWWSLVSHRGGGSSQRDCLSSAAGLQPCPSLLELGAQNALRPRLTRNHFFTEVGPGLRLLVCLQGKWGSHHGARAAGKPARSCSGDASTSPVSARPEAPPPAAGAPPPRSLGLPSALMPQSSLFSAFALRCSTVCLWGGPPDWEAGCDKASRRPRAGLGGGVSLLSMCAGALPAELSR